VTLALGFYAQFESGLPAYAITVLGVPARTIGTASAVNCLVIVVLQMAVVKWTAKRSGPSLLVAVGSIWVLSWLLLASASVVPVLAGTMFIMVFGVFAVGETMYAPVLNPLTASLAPSGMVGTTLGIFAAFQTGVSAAGPMLAGFALNAGHGSLFVGVHVGISLVAVFAALRLRSLLAGARVRASQPGGKPRGGIPSTLEELVVEAETGDLRAPQPA
jgi:MFS family permease